MSNLRFVETADGSKTIYNPAFDENYHSVNGAWQESMHVFVAAGLQHAAQQAGAENVSVLEVGFGTGLNFLLSADLCISQRINLHYTGIEAYPLTPQMLAQSGYEQYIAPSLWQNFIVKYPEALTAPVQVHPNIMLGIAPLALMDFVTDRQFDVIYFDAFASAKQPEMWTEDAIAHTVQYLKPGGIFVTYAITGNLKRMLKALGCRIEKLPGAAGKREMLRAVKAPL